MEMEKKKQGGWGWLVLFPLLGVEEERNWEMHLFFYERNSSNKTKHFQFIGNDPFLVVTCSVFIYFW